MNSPSEIETEDLEDEDARSKSPAMKDLLARAEQVWNQQHPDGRLKTTEGRRTDNGTPKQLNNEFNVILIMKVGTLTKMVLYRHDLHQ